ncbi:MAG: hypothetical protein AAGA18_02060 [Verrucomicrobiota bacterium]
MAKRKHNLEPLLRLRQYEYEMEQSRLKKCRIGEQECESQLHHLQRKLTKASEVPLGKLSAGQYAVLDSYRWKMKGEIEVAARKLHSAFESSKKQMKMTMLAKQKLEMVERILINYKKGLLKEEEMSERKLLDDLAQRKSSLSYELMEESI